MPLLVHLAPHRPRWVAVRVRGGGTCGLAACFASHLRPPGAAHLRACRLFRRPCEPGKPSLRACAQAVWSVCAAVAPEAVSPAGLPLVIPATAALLGLRTRCRLRLAPKDEAFLCQYGRQCAVRIRCGGFVGWGTCGLAAQSASHSRPLGAVHRALCILHPRPACQSTLARPSPASGAPASGAAHHLAAPRCQQLLDRARVHSQASLC